MHITKYIIITVVERLNMFYSNKYTNWYYSIIKNIQCQDRRKLSKTHRDFIYYERHHIIPKSLTGRIWITNGKKTIRIFSDDIMPDGFTKGRK